jgi:non-canonical poly(A) RNA polymerase PAPD5/7
MVDGPDRFKISEDFSDSQTEADMDMSASEHSSGNLPDKKRVKLATDAEASAVPKWSNPDPYTALPPPDESRVKKRDVVKLIRKSKVATILPSASQNAIAENADFVSFDFASDQDDDEDQSTTSTNQPQHNDYQSRYGGAQNGRPQKSLKRKRQDDEGDVIPAWIASSQAVATPWNQADHSVTQLMGLW